MSWFRLPQILLRPTSGALVLLGGGTAGGYAYRSYTSDEQSEALNLHSFSPYTLTSKNAVSSTSSVFTLRPRYTDDESKNGVKEACKKGIWSVQAKQPQLQIARSYTPLPLTGDAESEEDLRILIRREEGGEVSNYLHKLPEEATVNLRGPYIELEVPENTTEVLFLAGGTGIAPALQVANMLAYRKDMKLHILWANRKREECIGGKSDVHHLPPAGLLTGWKSLFQFQEAPLPSDEELQAAHKDSMVAELNNLKSKSKSGSLIVEYFVDEEGNFIKESNVLQHAKQLARTNPVSQSSLGEKYILVSGPDGFIEYLAGKKVWVGGREAQGPLGGVLAKLDLPGWKIVKL